MSHHAITSHIVDSNSTYALWNNIIPLHFNCVLYNYHATLAMPTLSPFKLYAHGHCQWLAN